MPLSFLNPSLYISYKILLQLLKQYHFHELQDFPFVHFQFQQLLLEARFLFMRLFVQTRAHSCKNLIILKDYPQVVKFMELQPQSRNQMLTFL